MGNKALHIVVLRFRAELAQVSGACMLLATESNLSSSCLLSNRDIPESSASSRKSFDQNEQHKIISRKSLVVNLMPTRVSFSLTKKFVAKHGKFTSESGGKGTPTSYWPSIGRAMRHCKREYPGGDFPLIHKMQIQNALLPERQPARHAVGLPMDDSVIYQLVCWQKIDSKHSSGERNTRKWLAEMINLKKRASLKCALQGISSDARLGIKGLRTCCVAAC